MTARYVILFPGDETAWEEASQADRDAVGARHEEFGRLLREHGHTVLGGASLTHSRQARLVRTDAGGRVIVSEGPFAETTEQVTGYYDVETDDLDDLLQLVGIVAGPDHVRAGMGSVEVRRAEAEEDEA